jgi:hypothetical protein
MSHRYYVWTVALSALLCSSCGLRDGREPVYPVSGQVLFNGRPTPNALVVFHPFNDSGKGSLRPSGTADQDGRFTLTTYDGHDGAPEGGYKVTVQWLLSTATKATWEGDDFAVINRLPRRYGEVHSTNLTARITRGNNELEPFRLSR